MKKNGMVALLLMGSISMYGQTTSKMTLSGRVKGFTDTPTLICDLSMDLKERILHTRDYDFL